MLRGTPVPAVPVLAHDCGRGIIALAMGRRDLRIGVIGAGFLADTRARCWGEVANASVVAVASRDPSKASLWADRHGVPAAYASIEELIDRANVDAVDLCVPNAAHRPLAEVAAAAGCHVICTKPLTAYVGQDLPEGAEDADVSSRPRAEMARYAERDARDMIAAAEKAGVLLCYGENWLYAPAVKRAQALFERSGGTLLEMRGWEAHNGSHSPYAKTWRYTGGGALLRLGAHPVGAMLHLKRIEGLRERGTPILPVSVTGEVADLTQTRGANAENTAIATGWQDVENWGCAIIAFDDGSRAVAYGSDNHLGGMQSRLELFGSNFHFECNLSPNDQLMSYAPDPSVLGDAYLIEKQSTSAGWNAAMVDEDFSSGQLGMIRAFADALRSGTPPAADGWLGLQVARVIYAAYVAAEEGRRVLLGAE